jgi:hypothetical protein
MAGPFLRSAGLLNSLSKTHDRGRALMKIVLVAAGPLFIALGLFWFGQAVGLLSGPHNAVLIDVGAGVAALGIGLGWFASR